MCGFNPIVSYKRITYRDQHRIVAQSFIELLDLQKIVKIQAKISGTPPRQYWKNYFAPV